MADMLRDSEIVITGGVPIGLVVMGVGLATGIEELTLTGIGIAGAAVAIAGLWTWVAPDAERA